MNSECGRDAIARIEDCVRADTGLRDRMHQDGKKFWDAFRAEHGLGESAVAPAYFFIRACGTMGFSYKLFIVFRGATLVVRYTLYECTIVARSTALESQATADGWIGNERITFDRVDLPVAHSPIVDGACAIERKFAAVLAPLGDYMHALDVLCAKAHVQRFELCHT